jgi:hypothetical protein
MLDLSWDVGWVGAVRFSTDSEKLAVNLDMVDCLEVAGPVGCPITEIITPSPRYLLGLTCLYTRQHMTRSRDQCHTNSRDTIYVKMLTMYEMRKSCSSQLQYL